MRLSKRQPGFTIIETLVAMTITLVMLFLIHTLFQISSSAVSLGVGLSDIIGTSRAIGDQIERDAKEMFGPLKVLPEGPGVMVIVCERLDNVKYRERNGAIKARKVRVDQLMFTRGPARSTKTGGPGLGATPIASAGDATFSPPLYDQINKTAAIEAVRVYYGHGVAATKDSAGNLVAPALGTGENEVATFWPLCRHALFFLEDEVNGTTAANGTANPINRAVGAFYNSTVSNMAVPPGLAPPLLLHHGTTDIADIGYYSTAVELPNTNGVLISDTNAGTLYGTLVDGAYRTAAINLTYATQRLWVNKNPEVNTAAPLPSSVIAQMHPILAENCSDFIVEFAGDYLDEGSDLIEDQGPDIDATTKELIWYGLDQNDNSNTKAFPAAGLLAPWVTTGLAPTPQGAGAAGTNQVAFVFRHDQPAQWPYLIRIRYRLHDKRGELQGSYSPETELAALNSEGKWGTNYGRWFEQIIKVNR